MEELSVEEEAQKARRCAAILVGDAAGCEPGTAALPALFPPRMVEIDPGGRVQKLMEEYIGLRDEESEATGRRGDGARKSTAPALDALPLPGRPVAPSPARPVAPKAPSPRRVSRSSDLRAALCEAMTPLVESIARRYAASTSEPLDDLISEGYVGLLTAIDLYCADRGARFCTYATHRVHGQIRHYLRDRGSRRLIRAPSWLQELTSRLRREEATLEADLGRPATVAELAVQLNLKEEAVEELQAHGGVPAVLSLTEGGGEEDGAGGVDLSKIRSQHYVSWQLPVEDRIFLEGMMVRLKELERKVITLFFFQEFSQTEIARTMNISCNYVGYLLKNGLGKLRRQIEADELRDAQLQVRYSPRRCTGDAAVIDAATGLYNADYFRRRLTEEIARASRHGQELAVLVIRVPLPAVESNELRVERPTRADRRRSGLSTLNSQLSTHREAVLSELGVALRECLRKADIPARVEEGTLAIVLPHTGDGAAAAAARITDLVGRVMGDFGVAASGYAVYPTDGKEASVLLEIAASRTITSDRCLPGHPIPVLA